VTSDPRAFFAIDQGAATTSAALVGRLGSRWRLLGAIAMPVAIPVEAIIEHLGDRVLSSDSDLEVQLDAGSLGRLLEWPRLVARSAPPPSLVVLAASETTRIRLEAAGSAAGWRTAGMSLETAGPHELVGRALEPGLDAVLVGTDDPPSRAERNALNTLSAIVDALEDRRPDAIVVLAGALGLATPEPGEELDDEPATGPLPAAADDARMYAPAPRGTDPDDPLVAVLRRFRGRSDDVQAGIARATASLAAVMERRLEAVAVGLDSGLRVAAWPVGDPESEGRPAISTPGVEVENGVASLAVNVASGGFVPDSLDDPSVDGVLSWSTASLDRIRLRDRLHELRIAPWGHPDGDGAVLRLAAARAALTRIVAATPTFDFLPAPDVVIASGGVFAPAPGPAIALALADVLRRPAVSQFCYDHARLLGPLGTIPDEHERRLLLSDLADDLLAPLGSIVSPQGVRAGRSAGKVVVHGGTGSTELELVPGSLQLVDLPPGQVATAEFEFRDPVILGVRGRRFAVEVGGGLGGLLIDLRDVPLRLPDRLEHRRELLAAWQGALWAGGEG